MRLHLIHFVQPLFSPSRCDASSGCYDDAHKSMIVDTTAKTKEEVESIIDEHIVWERKTTEAPSGKENDELLFGPNPSEPTQATLDLLRWLKRMSNPKGSTLGLLDPAPLTSRAKEFLFPCARDDFTLSKNLEEGGAEGEEINGQGWVQFAEESLCR